MDNYSFCVHYISKKIKTKKVKVLDYGCGDGKIVKKLRDLNINSFGCDVFYEGGDRFSKVQDGFLKNEIIKRMGPRGPIPFESNSFDIVVSNQVFEHVEDIDYALSEIKRVLTDDGIVLSLFPDKGVFREGHCGILFLHWFPSKSKIRFLYAALLRALGFGYHKKNKSIWGWSVDFCHWLDKWTFYRSKSNIEKTFKKFFSYSKNIEPYYLVKRFPICSPLIKFIPSRLITFGVNKFANLVFVSSANYGRIIEN